MTPKHLFALLFTSPISIIYCRRATTIPCQIFTTLWAAAKQLALEQLATGQLGYEQLAIYNLCRAAG